MCDLPQKTVKYWAFCLWIVFGLDAGKCQLIRTMWIQFFLSKDENAVKDDFVTWDEEKYDFVKEVLWQEGGTATFLIALP